MFPALFGIVGITLLLGALSQGCKSGDSTQKSSPPKKTANKKETFHPKKNKVKKYRLSEAALQIPKKVNKPLEGFHFVTRLELKGDPSKGKILFYRNSHRPSAPYSPETHNNYMLAGPCQHSILQNLLGKKTKNLFVEGFYDTYQGGKLLSLLIKYNRNSLIRFFDFIHSQKEWDDRSLIDLAVLGGAEVYGLTNNEVVLHKIMNREDDVKLFSQAKALSETPWPDLNKPEVRTIVYDKREELVTKELIRFLKANPGAEIALIFGRDHQFCDDFIDQGFQPNIISMELYKNNKPLDPSLPTLPKSCVPEDSGD